MGFAFRTCIVDADDALVAITAADYARLAGGALELPRFAGRVVRTAHLAVEFERGRPTGWVHEDYVLLPFAADGRVERGDARLRVRLALMDRPDPAARPPAGQGAARRAIASLAPHDSTWSPSPALRARILSFSNLAIHR